MKVLAFDSSNKTLSVAIFDTNELLAEITINIKKNHSVSLMPTIDFLMESVDLKPSDLNRIAVAQGPGSYTGLRVAVATAKTLAYSLHIDLVGVSSLYALAASVASDGLIIPIIDARRQNVYAGVYKAGQALEADMYISFDMLIDKVKHKKNLVFVGETANFSEKIAESLPQAKIIPSLPSAYEIGKLGQKLAAVDVDSFVPQYLKRVEAEENWLKTHEGNNHPDYVKRV
jgi:tRNA threonylcarbamoyl adenosine modification protein YeaZ